jgi:4'-phosphopantetheinyl transferase
MDVDVWVMRVEGALARAARDSLTAEYPGCAVSFSDSDGIAVVAIASEGAVGADVERVRTRPRLDAIARRVFSPEEARALATAPAAARLSRFYRAWTATEATAKARGLGLPSMLAARTLPGMPVTWFEPARGFIAAVAAPAGTPRLRVRERA